MVLLPLSTTRILQKATSHFVLALTIVLAPILAVAQIQKAQIGQYKLYPDVNTERPDLPSPFIYNNQEFVVAETKDDQYAIMEVTMSDKRGICQQMVIDTLDFPELVQNGLHYQGKLLRTTTITGWSVDTISKLGQPGGLSNSGFMAQGEDIITVMATDNQLVDQLGLTHPALAKALFHVLNMMDADLTLKRWNMAKHQWENIKSFFYNGQKVNVIAYDTKGGQKSIFNDGLGGAFHVRLWRELSEAESKYLICNYGYLPQDEYDRLVNLLTEINIGELQPQYIMRYGFYEGHTVWRAEPMAIALIFGMKSLEELDNLQNHHLYQHLTQQYTF